MPPPATPPPRKTIGPPFMRWIVGSSIRFRFLVLAVGAVLMVVGFGQVRSSAVDVFPEFAPPTVEIQTECVGLSPAEVEQVVTTPLEQVLAGVPGLDVMRSSSIEQLSDIVMIFKPGTDVLHARELVQEKLAQVRPTLPNWAAPPAILPPKSSTSRILEIGITSKTVSAIDMSVIAENKIRGRLLRVPGVANVSIWGQRRNLIQVQVDPQQLHDKGVTLDQIVDTSSNALDNGVLRFQPSGSTGTGGFLDVSNQRLQVEHKTPIVTPEELANTVLDVRNGQPLKIGDVSSVVVDHQQLIGDAVINGGPGLMLIVDKFPWGNTKEVTAGVDAALAEMAPGLPGLEIDPTIFRPATFIDDAIHNLTSSIVLGSLLVLLTIALFLFEWRSALISIVTIPISLMACLLVLYAWDVTINTMILAGLVIALGAIIIDAIIDIENIVRRLRQHRLAGSQESTASIILDASVEVRSAVVYASFIEVVALAPILFLHGLTGSFFRPLAIAYALAVLVSLVVALVLTPALAMILLRKAPLERRGSPITRVLQAGYGALLARVVRRPLPAFLVGLVIVGAGAAGLPRTGEELFPTFKERNFLIHWISTPGTSVAEETRIVTRGAQEMQQIPGVRNFGSHIGRAIQGEEVVGVNFGEDWVSIDPKVDYQETFDAVGEVAAGYPGLYTDVQTYLRERISEVITGDTTAIVVRIYGPDLTRLREIADSVGEILGDVPGTKDPEVEFQQQIPQIQIEVDLAAAERYGLKPGDVRRAAAMLIGGEEVGSVFKNDQLYDVFVWSKPEIRTTPDSVKNLLLDTPSGGQVRMSDVAQVRVTNAPNVVRHENGFRRIDVGTNVEGRDLGAVAREIEQDIKSFPMPEGYHAEVIGEYQERQSAQHRLFGFAIAATIGVLVLLRISFRSWRLAWLSFLTLPIALVGGELAVLMWAGGTISLGALVGFFAVLGIVARNGIMLITHYQHLEEFEGEPFGPALVIRGAKERLAPVLMTGLATATALLPLVIKGNVAGQEIEYPLALVILGGLLTSALLNLFILPTLYLKFAKPRSNLRGLRGFPGIGHSGDGQTQSGAPLHTES
ncbi:MAG TPA: efflux RND transporter permease subunit [Sporichthya sp.]|nr:efflux RND transporter permease subunit [Sporichthya sp.]